MYQYYIVLYSIIVLCPCPAIDKEATVASWKVGADTLAVEAFWPLGQIAEQCFICTLLRGELTINQMKEKLTDAV